MLHTNTTKNGNSLWLYSNLNLISLLKLEITVSFLWLSLPVRKESLKRIKYSKLFRRPYSSLECFHCSLGRVQTSKVFLPNSLPKLHAKQSTLTIFHKIITVSQYRQTYYLF